MKVKPKKVLIPLHLNENYFSHLKLDNAVLKQFLQLTFQHYPHRAMYEKLEQKAAKLYQTKKELVLVTNGSDDAIFLIQQAFALPNKKSPMLFLAPTFSMYKHYAEVLNIKYLESKLNENFLPNFDELKLLLQKHSPSVCFLPNPLAPTGAAIKSKNIEELLKSFPKTKFVIDEAYIEFSNLKSFCSLVPQHENLLVLRTLSKFFGLAALRIGFVISQHKVNLLNIQPPFSLSVPNVFLADKTLDKLEVKNVKKNKDEIIHSRKKIFSALKQSKFVNKISESEANFIFFTTPRDEAFLVYLLTLGFQAKGLHASFPHAIRLGIPSPSQAKKLLKAIQDFDQR